MEKAIGSNSSRTVNRGVIEGNTLAILDATDSKYTRDANDDRIAYLEAVRAASILPENGTPPTNKMYGAIFQILRNGKSLELMMASFLLLNELDKRFPRRFMSKPPSGEAGKLEVVDEPWSPFTLNSDVALDVEAAGKNSDSLFDSSCFYQLIEELNEAANGTEVHAADTKFLGNMLLLQYLVNVLEGDFRPRNRVYAETENWQLLRESQLNTLLASRRINYKSLMKDCLSIMCGLSQVHVSNPNENGDIAMDIGLVEVQRSTCLAMQRLLVVIMELDVSRKKADSEGYTTRADGVRTPLLEIILDELTYNRHVMSPFFQVFTDPEWKLGIILQYFLKYIAKPAVRTRRSGNVTLTEDPRFSGVLKCFSNSTSTRNISKKIGADMVQLLIAHAFLAHLAVSSQQNVEGTSHPQEEGSSLVEICDHVITALDNLRRTNGNMEISTLAKEAVFTAATIRSIISEKPGKNLRQS